MAELTGRNNEIRIHRHLASRAGARPGSDHVLAPLDHLKVRGPNGEHDVLVSQVLGPHLEYMLDEEPSVFRQAIKSLARQIALGISFLHDCGVVHAGLLAVLSTSRQLIGIIQICTKATSHLRPPIWTGNPNER